MLFVGAVTRSPVQMRRGRRRQLKIEAAAKAEAVKLQAESERLRYEVEAKGQMALNEARNLLRDELLRLDLKKALIEGMPEILEASMKPVEKIKDIRILDMGGGFLGNGHGGGNGAGGNGAATGKEGSLADSLVDALLRYRIQSPVVEEMLKELGLEGARLPALLAERNGTEKKPDKAE